MRPSPRNQNCSRLALLACGALAFLATACVHRININQGNFLDPEKVAQVQPGMTRSQVRYLLGTPLASTPFGNDRWDYVFYFRQGRARNVTERKVVVYFESDKVTRIDRPAEEKPAEKKDEKAAGA